MAAPGITKKNVLLYIATFILAEAVVYLLGLFITFDPCWFWDDQIHRVFVASMQSVVVSVAVFGPLFFGASEE